MSCGYLVPTSRQKFVGCKTDAFEFKKSKLYFFSLLSFQIERWAMRVTKGAPQTRLEGTEVARPSQGFSLGGGGEEGISRGGCSCRVPEWPATARVAASVVAFRESSAGSPFPHPAATLLRSHFLGAQAAHLPENLLLHATVCASTSPSHQCLRADAMGQWQTPVLYVLLGKQP